MGAALVVAAPAGAQVLYSLDQDSPSGVGVSNSDVLAVSAGTPAAGSAGGPPAVETAATVLGLSGGSLDEVDALSRGGAVTGAFHFSVDRYSLRRHAGASGPATSDDLDALALEREGPLFFSLAAGNLFAFGGADVLAPGPSVAIPAAALGLGFLDDIDALHVDDSSGDVYFSLTPASPTLATLGASAADVLVVREGKGRPEVFAAAADVGLRADDNLDALAFTGPEEPGIELAGPCSVGAEVGSESAPRAAVADLIFSGGSGEAVSRVDPACGRDLALRPPAVVACAGVAPSACP
ncbi:MAG: hypothetical protein QNK04_12100 [Myxococcota bacterium]|nr:hypothetical protein [Myxococcota bacterium]